MEKISSQKVAAVLSTVPVMLRNLAQERDDLLTKVASLQQKVEDYERRERVESIAKEAEAKHLHSLGETMEEKIAHLEQAVQSGRNIDIIEEAVKLSAKEGSIAQLSIDDKEVGNGASELESYLLGSL